MKSSLLGSCLTGPDDGGAGVLGDVNRAGAERNEILLARGELDELHISMGELGDLVETISTPESNTMSVNGCKISTKWRPFYISLRPPEINNEI